MRSAWERASPGGGAGWDRGRREERSGCGRAGFVEHLVDQGDRPLGDCWTDGACGDGRLELGAVEEGEHRLVAPPAGLVEKAVGVLARAEEGALDEAGGATPEFTLAALPLEETFALAWLHLELDVNADHDLPARAAGRWLILVDLVVAGARRKTERGLGRLLGSRQVRKERPVRGWLILLVPAGVLLAGCTLLPRGALPGGLGGAVPSPSPTARLAAQPTRPVVSPSPVLTLTVRPGSGLTPTMGTPVVTPGRTVTVGPTLTPTARLTVTASPVLTRTVLPGGTAGVSSGVAGGLGDVPAIISATVEYVLKNTNLTGFEVEYQTTVREYARTRVQRRGDPASTQYAILRWTNGVWSVVAYGTNFPNARELGIPEGVLPGGLPVGTPSPIAATATRPPPSPSPGR